MAVSRLNIDKLELDFDALNQFVAHDIAVQVKYKLTQKLKKGKRLFVSQNQLMLNVELPSDLPEHRYAEYIANEIEGQLK